MMSKNNQASINRHTTTTNDDSSATNVDALQKLIEEALVAYKLKHEKKQTNEDKVKMISNSVFTKETTKPMTTLHDDYTENNEERTINRYNNRKTSTENQQKYKDDIKSNEEIINLLQTAGEVIFNKLKTITKQKNIDENRQTGWKNDALINGNKLNTKDDLTENAPTHKKNALTDKKTFTGLTGTKNDLANGNIQLSNSLMNYTQRNSHSNIIKSINRMGEITDDNSRQKIMKDNQIKYSSGIDDNNLQNDLMRDTNSNIDRIDQKTVDQEENALTKSVNSAGNVVMNTNSEGNGMTTPLSQLRQLESEMSIELT